MNASQCIVNVCVCVCVCVCWCVCVCVCVRVYLGEAGLVIQYAENAMWPRGNQLQTGVEVLEWHRVPLDLFCTVLLLWDRIRILVLLARFPITR